MRTRSIAFSFLAWAATAFPAHASEAGRSAGGSALITPRIGLIFWTTITFVLLVFLLRRVAWKPLLGAIEERERSVREALEQSKREREEAAALLAQHHELLREARRERAEAAAAGQKDAERLKAEIPEEAKRQRESIVKQTTSQVEATLRQARGELREVAADLAIRAASKLLARNLDDAAQRKLVEDYLSDLDRLPAAPRADA
jgi:F-type H+-transporting ATPase subunit b